MAALSSYENRAISSGVLLLDTDDGSDRRAAPPDAQAYRYSPGADRRSRASTGCATASTRCSSSIGTGSSSTSSIWSSGGGTRDPARSSTCRARAVPRRTPSRPPAIATSASCSARSHEIKVFAEGAQMFSFRNARWHLLDLQAKYRLWSSAVGNRRWPSACSRRRSISRTRARARSSSCCAIAAASLPLLVAPRDQLDVLVDSPTPEASPTASQLMHMLRGRTATSIDPAVLGGLARIDGATVMDTSGRLLAVGAILLHTGAAGAALDLAVEGARTTAAMAAGAPRRRSSRSARTASSRSSIVRNASGISRLTRGFVPPPARSLAAFDELRPPRGHRGAGARAPHGGSDRISRTSIN